MRGYPTRARFSDCGSPRGYIRQGATRQAKLLLEDILATAREFGYRRIEGLALRLLGESLAHDDPAAADHLEAARRILEEIGARNEVAKAFTNLASSRRAAGAREEARRLLQRALELFEELGTTDEAPRVRAALAELAAARES